MLIRHQPRKKEQKNHDAAQNPTKTKHDIYEQIIKLTKENQFLRTKVDCLQHELERTINTKEKYRTKYKVLKEEMALSTKNESKRKDIEFIKGDSQGKIYTNPKFDKTRKKI